MRHPRRLALGLLVAALVPTAVGIAYAIASRHVPLPATSFGPRGFAAAFATAFAVTGYLLATRRADNPIGWLFLAGGVLSGLQELSDGYAIWAVAGRNATTMPARLAAVGEDWLWLLGFGLFGVAVALFPDGRPVSPRWRPWIVAGAIGTVGSALGFALSDRPSVFPGVDNPIGLPGAHVIANVLSVGFLLLLVVGLASALTRYRRTTGDEHEQMKWLAASVGFVVGSFVLYAIAYLLVPDSSTAIATNALEGVIGFSVLSAPIAIGVGVLKYRLYDIDVVIRKTVVYAILVVLILLIAAVGVALIGAIVVGPAREHPSALLAAGLMVGLLVWPLRSFASRIADRVVFGGRRTSYEVLTEFSERMTNSYAADDVVLRLARVAADGVGASSAVVWIEFAGQRRPGAWWPGDVPHAEAPENPFEIRHQGELLGAISVQMPANDPMTPTKEQILRDLASQAGLALRNVRLLEEVRESRRRIVAAQDERARKLERDIHDGAQQQLVAFALKLRLAEQLIGRDDEHARHMLTELQADAQDALEDLRDLARGIYPPLLADQGLTAALEAQARKAALPVTVEADGIERFSQDVEATVYFCALEALNNVAKYAGATRARIRLSNGDAHLRFEIHDDGAGFDPAETGYGTGLQGMADRLAAQGGTLRVTSAPGAGTTIEGRLPA